MVVGGGARGVAVSGCCMECCGEGTRSTWVAQIWAVASVLLEARIDVSSWILAVPIVVFSLLLLSPTASYLGQSQQSILFCWRALVIEDMDATFMSAGGNNSSPAVGVGAFGAGGAVVARTLSMILFLSSLRKYYEFV